MAGSPISEHRAAANDIMLETLEIVAEAGKDIVPLFFERFYLAYPEERVRFCNRAASEGLMVNEMLSMLLAQAAGEPWLQTMMRARVNTHHDHGDIQLEQYRVALDMLVDVLKTAAAERWQPEYHDVWREAATKLFAIIAKLSVVRTFGATRLKGSKPQIVNGTFGGTVAGHSCRDGTVLPRFWSGLRQPFYKSHLAPAVIHLNPCKGVHQSVPQ